MKTTVIRERPFEYLRRRGGGEAFPEETVRNWYIARAFVLDRLKEVSIAPDSSGCLHFVVEGDSPRMLSVVRQLALSAHFVNFSERDCFGRLVCRNRTLVTLVSRMDADAVVAELRKEEYLCNLLQYCKYSVCGEVFNKDAYLDMEFQIVPDCPSGCPDAVCIKEEDIDSFISSANPDEVFSIDTRKAVLVSRVYELGSLIDNLPAEDIHSARRYILALDTFQYTLLGKKFTPLVKEEKWMKNQLAVRNGLSNIFCSDCFDSRARGIKRYAAERGVAELQAWEDSNEALTCSEHNRWMVEKLIMGFRAPSAQEWLEYESLYARKKAAYAKMLKNNADDPVHVDLCSCLDLRRSDPDNLKYDSFLLLAIPIILNKIP